MSESKNLELPYFAAESTEHDGAAAVQMILGQIVATPIPSQADIDQHIQTNNSEPQDWYSDPDGVTGALNELKPLPPIFNGIFLVYNLATENEASRRITFTLHNYQVATATLVYNGGHWIVVKGVQTDVNPLTSSSYNIEGFWIHNPWPNYPIPGQASQNVWIDYATWTSDYFTFNVYGSPGGKWLDRYISVCDPTPLAIGELESKKRKPRADGHELIYPNKVVDFVLLEIKELSLSSNKAITKILQSGHPDKPVLVQRLDHNDMLDYLVPWCVDDRAVALFRIDARFGLLREVALFAQPARWPNISRIQLMQKIESGAIEVCYSHPRRSPEHWRRYSLRLRPGTWSIQESLIWLPCWESRNPSFPFYVLSSGDQIFYISTLDGTVYGRLRAFGGAGRVPRGGA